MFYVNLVGERTLADERWYGIIHERAITPKFIEQVTGGLEYADEDMD